MFKNLGLTIAMFGIPSVILFAAPERATSFGHTDIPIAAQYQDITPDHQLVSADNYGVFKRTRMILVRTELAPVEIKMVGGQLMRQDTVLFRMLPVHFYQPASGEETKLWRHYFG